MEHKYLDGTAAQLKIDDSESGSGVLVGYGAVFGNVDRGGDVIERGAFASAIPGFLRDGFVALGHDWGGLPIAYVTNAVEDDYGLLVRAEFHSTKSAQDVRTMVRERLGAHKTVGLSIGYGIEDGGSSYREDGRTRRLTKLALYEFSVVTVPMNPLAGALGAKSFADHFDATLAVVEEFARRAGSLRDLRAKEGRVLSAGNRDRMRRLHGTCGTAVESMGAVMADLAALLEETEPRGPEKSARARHLRAQELKLRAALTGALAGDMP